MMLLARGEDTSKVINIVFLHCKERREEGEGKKGERGEEERVRRSC